MNGPINSDECPRCGSFSFKRWEELTDDELFVARRMPSSAAFNDEERKKHRICTRCWFEQIEHDTHIA